MFSSLVLKPQLRDMTMRTDFMNPFEIDDMNQNLFNNMIGSLDRILSDLLICATTKNGDDSCVLDEANFQTLKHHAEDMLGVGIKLLRELEIGFPEHLIDKLKEVCFFENPFQCEQTVTQKNDGPEPLRPPRGLFTKIPDEELPKPKFSVGNRVSLIDHTTSSGEVVAVKWDQPSGKFHYNIRIDNGDIYHQPESNLELVMVSRSVKSMWPDVFIPVNAGIDFGTPAIPQRTTFSTGAERGIDKQSRLALIPLEALEAMGEALAEGEVKYGRDNWIKGIPMTNLLEHAIRHCYAYLRGHTTENDIGHALWNLMAAAYFMKNRPDLDDRPQYHKFGVPATWQPNSDTMPSPV